MTHISNSFLHGINGIKLKFILLVHTAHKLCIAVFHICKARCAAVIACGDIAFADKPEFHKRRIVIGKVVLEHTVFCDYIFRQETKLHFGVEHIYLLTGICAVFKVIHSRFPLAVLFDKYIFFKDCRVVKTAHNGNGIAVVARHMLHIILTVKIYSVHYRLVIGIAALGVFDIAVYETVA